MKINIKVHLLLYALCAIVLLGITFFALQNPRFQRAWFSIPTTVNQVVQTVRQAANQTSQTASNARQSAEQIAIQLKNEASRFAAQNSFQRTLIQSPQNPRSRILLIGNDLDQATLDRLCRGIAGELHAVFPYSTFADALEISCGKHAAPVPGITVPTHSSLGTADPAAYSAIATMFLLANAQKIALSYDSVIILQNSAGRSWAVPPLASAIIFLKQRNGNAYSDADVFRTFHHEFTHLFACAADEYVDEEDLRNGNEIMRMLGLPQAQSQIDALSNVCLTVPNCIKKPRNGCPAGWYEGCGLVSAGTCRPSYNSIMRNGSIFNKPSVQRIVDSADGLAIYKTELSKILANKRSRACSANSECGSDQICNGICVQKEVQETLCNDELDNDRNGLTDCQEAVCSGKIDARGNVCASFRQRIIAPPLKIRSR